MATQAKLYYTPEQYLAMERDAPTRSEYIAGEIFAMSCASLTHSRALRPATRRFVEPARGGGRSGG